MYKIVTDYKSDDKLRLSFNTLAQLVFDIDFEKWYQMNCWTDKYQTFSYVNEGEIISNVSANILQIVYHEKEYQAIQIGTVMTRPEYRNQGLAGKLLDSVLNQFSDKADLFFLFADNEALPLYQRAGFKVSNDLIYTINRKSVPNNNPKLRKLSIDKEKDLAFIKSILNNKQNYSTCFSVKNGLHINLWHYIYALKDDLYYSIDMDCLIVCKLKGETLHLYDLVSDKQTDIIEIANSLNMNFKKIKIYFTPDSSIIKRLGSEYNDNILYLSQIIDLNKDFCYPLTSRA